MTEQDTNLKTTAAPETDEAGIPSSRANPETFGPALRSLWFLFFGLALGPAVLIFERDPQGNTLMWLGLGFLCLGVILHRLSLKYTLTEKKIEARSWWGRGPVETISLDRIGEVRIRTGWAGRLAGVAHLEILSLAPEEAGLTLLGQTRGQALADRLQDLARRARAEADGVDARG
jgi:hypothetical protein